MLLSRFWVCRFTLYAKRNQITLYADWKLIDLFDLLLLMFYCWSNHINARAHTHTHTISLSPCFVRVYFCLVSTWKCDVIDYFIYNVVFGFPCMIRYSFMGFHAHALHSASHSRSVYCLCYSAVLGINQIYDWWLFVCLFVCVNYAVCQPGDLRAL